MKLKLLAIITTTLCLNSGALQASTSLSDYINQSVEHNYRIKSLNSQHDAEKVRLEQEDKFYLPKLSIDHTTKMHMMDGAEKMGIRPFDNRVHESNVNLRSTIWRDNHVDVYGMLSSKADAAGINVEIEKSNIKAQITTAVYSIFLYENLVKEGEEILKTAKNIDKDISRKVKGGLAKASDSTTAEVLINDMDNAILATKLKIKQLRLNLEQISGVPYPNDMTMKSIDVRSLIKKTPSGSVSGNKALMKKELDVKAADHAIDTAENWVSVDLYAKAKTDNLTLNRMDSEIGVTVTLDIFNPINYWKDKSATAQFKSEHYMLQQMRGDLELSLESQLSILDSNRKLLTSQLESVQIKKELIRERKNEYQINQTSLYELIQAWNGFYSAIQMKTDTESTLINTILSIDVLTGQI